MNGKHAFTGPEESLKDETLLKTIDCRLSSSWCVRVCVCAFVCVCVFVVFLVS